MSSVFSAPAAARPALAGALHRAGWGPRRALWGCVLAFAIVAPMVYALFGVAMREPVTLRGVLGEMGGMFAIAVSAVFAWTATASRLRHRLAPAVRLAIAVAAAALVAALLIDFGHRLAVEWLGGSPLPGAHAKEFASATHRFLFEASDAAHWALVLVVLCELLEASRLAGEQLHAARMAALRTQHELVEGELRAMEARVDPDLLFDALAAVDRGYACDPGEGERRLDTLIRFLRAALPGDAAGASSVDREQERVDAYLALCALRPPAQPR